MLKGYRDSVIAFVAKEKEIKYLFVEAEKNLFYFYEKQGFRKKPDNK